MYRIAAFAVTAVLTLATSNRDSSYDSKADELAKEFLQSLNKEQHGKAQLPFEHENRKTWNYVPLTRMGITFGELNNAQTEKATKLLRASISDIGYKKVMAIRSLESVLFEMENKNPGRDTTKYYFTVYGEPSGKQAWGWRYEGHHVSLNFTYEDGRLVSSTPQFLGSNPAEVRSGPMKGFRALPKEQDLAFEFLDTLNEAQSTKAIVATTSPAEIGTSNQRKVGIQSKAGITYKELTPGQQDRLMALIKVHIEVQTPAEQARRLKRVEQDSIVFAWMGATKPGTGHYYRVQGSKFLIEYDNTQNDANHIHTVWRDFDGDFGEDVLAEHYLESHDHDHGHHHHDHETEHHRH